MQEDRKLAVLRAIVEDYVATQEPVGSKALVERHRLGVSPATVRNDMAALEEEGLIAQPHTSAGRIPTDKGYRFFVDRLTQLKPLSAAEKRAISDVPRGRARPRRRGRSASVRLLAQLTQQVAIVQYPTLARSTVRHVELVALEHHPAAVVLILSTGRVEQRVVELPVEIADDTARRPARPDQPRRRRASRSPTPPTALGALPEQVDAADREPGRGDRRRAGRGDVQPSGSTSAWWSAAPPTWPASATASTIDQADARGARGARRAAQAARRGDLLDAITVRIGHEGPYQELATTSVVATGYGPGDDAVGSLGIVGPTRMDYPGSMAAVRAVARYVSTILDQSLTPNRKTKREPGPLRDPRRRPATPTPTRSRRPTAGLPGSCTRT